MKQKRNKLVKVCVSNDSETLGTFGMVWYGIIWYGMECVCFH